MADEQRWEVPWARVGIAAGVGLAGLVVSLAVAAPVLVLGGLLWLALLGWLGWLVGRRGWAVRDTTPREDPPAEAVEAVASRHRLAAAARHARTQEVVAADLVPPGFVRPDRG